MEVWVGWVVRIVRIRGAMWVVRAVRVVVWRGVGGGEARRWGVQVRRRAV